jgi:DNA-binding CsgD family transcriptional regulator
MEVKNVATIDEAVARRAQPGAAAVRTGSPLFQTTRNGRIVDWNRPAEELTGIRACDALGRDCWEMIRGRDAAGGLVCHPGCSVARLAREGWPVRCTDLRVRLPSGVRRVTVSTIVVGSGADVTVLHPLQAGAAAPERAAPAAQAPELTARQAEILALLVDGLCAKEIATRLELSLATVRNHIHALLRRLGVGTQLAAAAKARELGLCRPPTGEAPRSP